MITIERVLPSRAFKSLVRMNYSRYKETTIEQDDKIDIVASTFAIDENNDVYAGIIGEKVSCPLGIDGNGCHILFFDYPNQTPLFVLNDILNDFVVGVKYRTDDCVQGIMYRYNYLWFEKPQIADSILFSYFKDDVKEVSIKGTIYCIVHINRD